YFYTSKPALFLVQYSFIVIFHDIWRSVCQDVLWCYFDKNKKNSQYNLWLNKNYIENLSINFRE
ncbi:MAG: hypothetical protein KAI79_15725, partial [Bacteroidales bacterium]|nr:hypothetical protein [Bacteroidales bacterium]